MTPVPVPAAKTFDLDLAAFEGPFDLLLTLVLKEELELLDVEVAGIVTTFVEQLTEAAGAEVELQRHLDAAGEFLILVASLLELKARELFPDGESPDLADLDPSAAAAELAERLEAYRRIKAAAEWLAERLAEQSDRYFRLGPPPLAPRPNRELPPQNPGALADAMRRLAVEPPPVSLAHMPLKLPTVGVFVERFRSLIDRRRRLVFDEEVADLSRIEQAVALLAVLELGRDGIVRIGQSDHLGPIVVWKGAG
ncbi:MAG: segregation and condensation protein A [Gaiellales bacterium]